MRFTHITLQNWRNFKKVSVPLQKRAFLVGPNASGKSNFLDVFRFLRDIVSVGGGFQDAVQRRGGVSKVRNTGVSDSSDIRIRVEMTEDETDTHWTYEIVFNQDKQSRPVLKQEIVTKNGESLLDRPNDEDNQDSERLTQTYLEQMNANQPFRIVYKFLADVRYLHIIPQLVREPERFYGLYGRATDAYGGDFLEEIASSTQDVTQKRLRSVSEALQTLIPDLQQIGIERDARGIPHLRAEYSAGIWFDEDQLSDGTLRLMGLLWSMLDGQGTLLLEEPELSLHLDIVRVIPQILARIQRKNGRQIFVSTHAMEMLKDEGIGLNELTILKPLKEGTTIQLASEVAQIETLVEGGLDLADAIEPHSRVPDALQLPLFADK
jgi:predicted ATPase